MLEVPRLKITDRGRYVSGQARIAQILEAAMDVLIEHGYSAITLREIARRCGIRVGAVSYYYDSREALIRDLVEAIIGPYVDEFDAIRQARERPAEDRFADVVRLILEDIQTKKTTRVWPELWVMATRDPLIQEMVEAAYSRARVVLNDLLAELNPSLGTRERETVAMFISASLEGTTMFIGYEKPWADRIEWVENIAVFSLLSLAKTITPERVKSLQPPEATSVAA